ncbi:MAG TPA: NifU family protein [Acidimicrobiales bacterium]|nr:NifU family protein [Acidimicrobiales bacterium]
MSIGSEDDELTYREAWEHIADLADGLANHPDTKVAERVLELLDWVDAVHRDGLGRMIEMTRAWRGEIFLESLARDEIVGTMLNAYGLGEGLDAEAEEEIKKAVDAAMAEISPLVESHGGSIEIVSVVDGVVSVRMHGTCNGCASSSATLTYGLEAALKSHWPSFRRLEEVDAPSEVNPETADLECVTAPADAVPEPQGPLLQIRGHEGR